MYNYIKTVPENVGPFDRGLYNIVYFVSFNFYSVRKTYFIKNKI